MESGLEFGLRLAFVVLQFCHFHILNVPFRKCGLLREVIKCESAKVNMYKLRKFDAKDFAFYTSAS